MCLEERAAALQLVHAGPVEGKHGVEEDRCNEQGKAQARRDAQGRKPPPAHDAALRSPRSTRPTVISNAVTSATTKKRQVAAAEPKPTFRTEERRVGKGWVSTGRSRWSRNH